MAITLDENFKGNGMSLSADKLTVNCIAGKYNFVRATEGVFAGKVYWECPNYTGSRTSFGIISEDATDKNTSSYTYSGSTGALSYGSGISYGDWSNGCVLYTNDIPDRPYISGGGSYQTNFGGFSPSDTFRILLDMDNREVYFYINDMLRVTQKKIPNKKFYPFIGVDAAFAGVSSGTVNFGATPFKYPIPAGYRAYDSSFYKLYLKNDELWGVNNSSFTKLANNFSLSSELEKIALIESTNYKQADIVDLSSLGNFKLLSYSIMNNKATCMINAVPKDQLILPKGLINIESFEGIDKVSLASNATNNGTVKLLVTNDLNNYQTYDFANDAWQTIDHTNLPEVLAQGVNVGDVQNITRDSWDIITNNKSGIGFAYLLKMEDVADGCDIDKISLTVDMKGTWEKSTHGSDYKYGYPSNKTLRVKLLASGDYKINYSEGEKKV